ncbi:aspartate--tRNA ligase msd1 [Friedmanniomyces endolithicus]|uniref:Aspartate--tRNA ligase msd1 n=1 Tax=Friedmanniomyces endolithicus TaxID=329885 RepID=A0AAN6FR35_9PEZI|nr:aspartate--tRNA ligase msd1 [Friedmanniomyces endolithicus]KAK0315523.1 aspartate--tRNA ligase msd1 [Friedmanniomyces endolithicus]KAK0322985.1 aspartate--tRNA ligase msd1 [Friedmanniomyces endolithicus]KAK0826983.1 aspartate--tRNA ligase msd1 [Friedmanniomyces endolithicus]KAK0995857.1 aspartate--tRNA ligase msd1 [Friedmanniomyces endolithicus]
MSLDWVVQIVSTATNHTDSISLPHRLLQDLAHHTPVVVEGVLKGRQAPKAGSAMITGLELKLENIVPLNTLPDDLIVTEDTIFGPNQRHLQIKHDKSIRDALRFRSKAARFIRDHLADSHGFEEFETPLLFKSTPEGAREFLVPTRSPGLAYALPQSPQQYKQILMASGIPRYMQIARCFRDEDLRADRQPEFTQVDLEMAFASGEDVMRTVESTVRALWKEMLHIEDLPFPFPRLTYEQAMSRYGSDKPDIRLGSEITRIDYMLPVDLIGKIGPHADPIVDVMKVPISKDANSTRKFVASFMDSAEALPFLQNPDGQPGIFIVDSRKPLQGLQPFGFEAAEQVDEMLALDDGDLLVLQARQKLSFAGGSTLLGNLRLALHKAAVKQGLLPAPKGFAFTWITDFPLFSPTSDSDPGQGGSAGIASTHHPFTAPKSPEDVDMLLIDPLQVTADHYDLVLNGVELGGGSRRIHSAEMQAFILRDILKMSETRMKDFGHLIEVLRAGCPPHAGMALGFDRLVAVMLGRESVRDVIAFPKSGRGQDLLVKSPTMMTEEQLKTYHLRLRDSQ